MTYICKCSDDVDNVDVVKVNEGDDEVQFVKVEDCRKHSAEIDDMYATISSSDEETMGRSANSFKG
jgi:hypothetical protein